MAVIFWTLCFSCIAIRQIESAKMLAIIPVPSYSHQIPYRPLWAALSRRGHEVTVLTTNPMNNPSLTNLTEINFHFNYDRLKDVDFTKKRFTDTWLSIVRFAINEKSHLLTESIYEHPEVRKMYAPNSGQKFDVLLIEILTSPGIYALAHRFNAPIIGLASLGLYSSNHYHFGSPVLPSHPSTWEMEKDTGFNLSFWQRMKNFIRQWHHMYHILNHFIPEQQAIAEKYLGKDIPNIADMERNISVVFCSQQEVISFMRPKTPNIIPFGHITKRSDHRHESLPKDLQEFLDNAPNGFIYISLGTNTIISSFSEHIQDIFKHVFTNLPCKIVWKSDIVLPDKPDNVYIGQWFPQLSILAHPNIRLFVYQGGVQSTEEAVYYTVPLVGIPILADQDTQVYKMVTLGVAKSVNIFDISAETLNKTILEVLNDKRYKERMIKIKELNEDKPYDILDNVIWWTEFVIRHKGAPHLRTSIAYDPWYQRYDMDIIAVLSITMFVIFVCILMIIHKLLIIFISNDMKKPVDPKKKIN